MRLPPLFRTTAFRLTVLFTALFAAVAAAFLTYIYVATAGEVTRRADSETARELSSLKAVYARGGVNALNQAIIERAVGERPFLYLLMDAHGKPITGNLGQTPVEPRTATDARVSFRFTDTDPDGGVVHRPAFGRQVALSGGERLFVGVDIAEGRAYAMRISRALWGAGVLVAVLGLMGGLAVARNAGRQIQGLTDLVIRVQAGDLKARAPVRGGRDEYDELALGLNGMLDRIERLMGGLRHAGDAIAHDLRSPLTRLRARLEAALIEAEGGRGDPTAALAQAVEDADAVLQTFNAVLAIARLEAAGRIANPEPFDAAEMAAGAAELYGPLCEDKGVDFGAELGRGLTLRGDRGFATQALANLLDNAVKYTPAGGAVMLRTRRRASGEVEVSVTDTGPGVPAEDRARVVQRFVRLENSRSQPGAGLGLAMVAAVAAAHGAGWSSTTGRAGRPDRGCARRWCSPAREGAGRARLPPWPAQASSAMTLRGGDPDHDAPHDPGRCGGPRPARRRSPGGRGARQGRPQARRCSV